MQAACSIVLIRDLTSSVHRPSVATMRINLSSVFVDDQSKALHFYTEVLGFQKKMDVPMGGEHRWLTVVSPAEPDGTQLLLEPDAHRAVKPYTAALFEDGIPATSFAVEDVKHEHERLVAQGVRFTQSPVDNGYAVTAVFDDTCGNLIQITGPLQSPPP